MPVTAGLVDAMQTLTEVIMTSKHPDYASGHVSEIAELIKVTLGYTQALAIGPNEYGLNFAFLRGSQIDLLARVEDHPDAIFKKDSFYFSPAAVRVDYLRPLKDPSPELWRLALFVRFSDRIIRRIPILWAGVKWSPDGSLSPSYATNDFEVMEAISNT